MNTVVTVSSLTLVIMILFLSSFSASNINPAQGQSLPSCPVGYQRNILGTCVPVVSSQSCPSGYHQIPPGFCVPDTSSQFASPYGFPTTNVTSSSDRNQTASMLLLQNSTKQYSTNSSLPVNESNVMNQTQNQTQNQQVSSTLQKQPLTGLQPQQQPQQNQQLVQSYPRPSIQQQWLTYEDPAYGIRIQIPSNWLIVSAQSDKIVEFKLPSATKPSFGSGPALDADLTISLQSIGSYLDTNTLQVKTATLEDYVAAEKNEINSLSTSTGKLDFRLEYLKDYQTTIGGNPAWKIEYMSYMSGRQGLYNIETYVMKDNSLYTLKFFSDPLKVPETIPIVQQIIDSFQIMR